MERTYKPEGLPAKSWRPEVFVDDHWSSNALRFATPTEAMEYAQDLHRRWTMTRGARAASDDKEEPNHVMRDGKAHPL